jgi:hypothetical protein
LFYIFISLTNYSYVKFSFLPLISINSQVSSHLPDPDFIDFLHKCKAALSLHTDPLVGDADSSSSASSSDTMTSSPSSYRGYIVFKENCAKKKYGFVMDLDDQSLTRTDDQFRSLFEKAGFQIVHTQLQSGFPKSFFPVRMYALKPISS